MSQTVLNIVALMILGGVMFSSVDFFNGHQNALVIAAIAPIALLVLVLLAPLVLRHGGGAGRFGRLQSRMAQARRAMMRVRAGLAVFRRPKLGAVAAGAQLGAWALQWVSCYVLLVALGLDHQAGMAAAAAVLFAVNITAVLPATPANLGVFQAACAAVLHTGWHVGFGTGSSLRRDPAGGGGHERHPDGHARTPQRGDVLARGAPPGDARGARQASRAAPPHDGARLGRVRGQPLAPLGG